jgi:hypothetical protein
MSFRESLLSNAWLGYHQATREAEKQLRVHGLGNYRQWWRARKDQRHYAELIARLEYPDHYPPEQRRGA